MGSQSPQSVPPTCSQEQHFKNHIRNIQPTINSLHPHGPYLGLYPTIRDKLRKTITYLCKGHFNRANSTREYNTPSKVNSHSIRWQWVLLGPIPKHNWLIFWGLFQSIIGWSFGGLFQSIIGWSFEAYSKA